MAAPNLKEIENGIYELEHEESSKSGYALLAALYTCRSEMLRQTEPDWQAASYAMAAPPIMGETIPDIGDSDFLKAIAGKEVTAVLNVLNEHMSVVQVVHPNAYESVIRKLNNL